MTDLSAKSCKPCEGGAPSLAQADAQRLLAQVPGWALNETATEIRRTFKFKNYYETMAFVNAVAYIANREDHHPDMEVGYNKCAIRFSTHSVGGLSENDFILAAKIDRVPIRLKQ